MKIRALQVASFDGNIGDIANHTGFRQSIKKHSENLVEFENLEMRNFYQNWGIMRFDDSFVELANKYDLLIFGGGGFFQTNVINSSTGVTIDLSPEVLSKIKSPILFNCLGIGESNTSIKQCEDKFGKFLKYLTDSCQYMVTVRNDNSYEQIKKLYGEELQKKILKVPDGGFFCKPISFPHAEISKGYKNIAINVACDRSDIRYPGGNYLSQEEFVNEFSEYCIRVLKTREDTKIIFVPHIYSDYEILMKIIQKIPDRYVRIRICCAACLNGRETNGLNNFDIYQNADLVVGMRYHANVVSIGMNVPTLGIMNLDAHIKLYDDIGIQHRCIPSNIGGFSEKLYTKTLEILDDPSPYKAENRIISNRLESENISYIRQIDKWLQNI